MNHEAGDDQNAEQQAVHEQPQQDHRGMGPGKVAGKAFEMGWCMHWAMVEITFQANLQNILNAGGLRRFSFVSLPVDSTISASCALTQRLGSYGSG
ncbi:hypothetical protein [Pseudomonas saponiphila]|uniref:hypothetical protein n=1 Tax=Pseudomonas saponiphila TaxID=556534 RepID=UPI00223EA102|nr:hypothetical protein [Pseudomonas saponiphila]